MGRSLGTVSPICGGAIVLLRMGCCAWGWVCRVDLEDGGNQEREGEFGRQIFNLGWGCLVNLSNTA